MNRLSLRTLGSVPEQARPPIDPRRRTTRIVHLGSGAFHRAHQAVYTEDCGDWGICGTTQRSASVADRLAPQDGLYAVLTRGPENEAARVIGSVREVINAANDPGALARRIADPTVTVVTMTVTEKGYRHDPATGRLRSGDPEVAADRAGRPPRTVLGRLVAGLAARRNADAGPLTVISCDNLPANGRLLARLVGEYVTDDDLADWIRAQVRFPSAMVDRIVPATHDDDRRRVQELLGVTDSAAVVAEPFGQWVIENSFAADRPSWERSGAVLTGDVAPYEQAKLRLLNAAHSMLAYLGALAGTPTIASAVADQSLAEAAWRLMRDDAIPTLAPPHGVELESYASSVLDRFANPALRHGCEQVATDGSHKLPQRLLDTVRERLTVGAVPRFATLAVAAWMRYVAAAVTDNGRRLQVEDAMADQLATAVGGAAEPAAVVAALLGVDEIFGDLAESAAFRALLRDQLTTLTRHGARGAARAAVSD